MLSRTAIVMFNLVWVHGLVVGLASFLASVKLTPSIGRHLASVF